MANSEGGSSCEDSDVDSRLQDLDMDLPEKKRKPGIIYLSSVPEGMNVSQTTSFFAQFGRVGRVFLQPDKKLGYRQFTEGWIEFLSKKVAKRVAEQINNTPVGGKRRHKSYYTLWNIKYLPRFKWVHLTERLAYEQAVKQQRMRTEISQVKREAEHFKESVKQQKRKKRKRETAENEGAEETAVTPAKKPFLFRQEEGVRRQTTEDATKTKSKKTKKGRKTKDKEERVTPAPTATTTPTNSKSKRQTTPKSAKSKKESKKSPSKHSGAGGRGGESGSKWTGSPPTSGKSTTPKKKSSRASRTPKKVTPTTTSSSRRKSGDNDVHTGGGGERSAFLKSVFGGGGAGV
eukprot:TRINITY_DN7026_c0_g1_i7.p1 TRINITY_DN7026_c0_g1~~TRINITY_DN7026_c0_g1_i7.p1  ORF type:complete len:346 (-),score=112.29 TRINITY_DN7026_c0_g1_i7:116-1153(-)